jgi:hypothetical protein
MSHLHLLPEANMTPRAPTGFVRRQRAKVAGVDLDTLDAEVAAAGGRIMYHDIESETLRRRGGGSERVYWYEIPAEAAEA